MKCIIKKNGILLLLLLLFVTSVIYSQKPPKWAPAHGYRAKTRHVYFPEQNMYYDIKKGVYIYLNKGKWEISAKVPLIFTGINLGKSTQIELDFYDDNPHKHNYSHKTKYKKGDKHYKHHHKKAHKKNTTNNII